MSIAAIIGGIGSLVGGAGASLAGSYATYKGQKDTNKTNIELARQGREHDVNMWNRQNEYNTPEMQMHRLKEAGLNPNLIYGSGQASTGNADAPKPAHVATVSNEMASFANNNAIQMLSAYQDWQVKKAQIRNIEEETQGKNIQNKLQAYYLPFGEGTARKKYSLLDYQTNTALSNMLDTDFKEREYKQLRHLRKDTLQSRLNESKERISLLQRSTRQKQLQIELDEQLKPHGMSTADQLWQRMLAPVIKDKFGGFMDFMNDPKKHFKDTFYKNKKK